MIEDLAPQAGVAHISITERDMLLLGPEVLFIRRSGVSLCHRCRYVSPNEGRE